MNGRVVDIPAFQVKPNNEVAMTESGRELTAVRASLEALAERSAVHEAAEEQLIERVRAAAERS